MLDNLDLTKILFLDIETVPQYENYSSMPEPMQELWNIKAKNGRMLQNEEDTPMDVYSRAGIYAEFGRVVCISVGAIVEKDGQRTFRLKSYFGDDEKEFLPDFIKLLDSVYSTPEHLLCAHNGKEFDFPFLARRILINGLKLPKILNTPGKKPWEVCFLDTMELWKFGDYKNYTSLNLLTHVFNIPTPKEDISGADVCDVYWKDKDLSRIVEYCQKDVLAIAQLLLRYRGEPLIETETVTVAE